MSDNGVAVTFDVHDKVLFRYGGRDSAGEILEIDQERVMAGQPGAAKVRIPGTFVWVPLSRLRKSGANPFI